MVPEETKSKKQQQECIINCLPDDLIEQIFLGLPVSTLLRCIEVCKRWYKFIRDPQFITAHLEQAPHCNLLFFPQESVLGHSYPSDATVFDETWSQSTLAVPVIGPDDFLCGSCNGLLCLYTKTSSIKIANLATGECLHLDKPVKNLKGDHFSFYRFGFHPVTKEYTVTHFIGEHQSYSQGTFNVIQIYTLGTEKWKNVKSSEALSLSCVKNYGVVNVNGAMYWLTEDTGASWKHAVISFDLSKETFVRIPLPETELQGRHRFWMTEINGNVSIATAEVLNYRPRMLDDSLQVWRLDNKVEQRWNLMYNIKLSPCYLPGPYFVHKDRIMMQRFCSDLYSYEFPGDNGEIRLCNRASLLDFGPRKPDNVQSHLFVKSLVRLEAYKKVGIVRQSKRQEGWELKKWEAWEGELREVEDAWRNVYELEQNSLALPRRLSMMARVVLKHLPDKVMQEHKNTEIDQILQHVPDCPDQHPRSQRRLNFVEWKRDNKKLSARMNGAKDITKASRQAVDDIFKVLSSVQDDLQASKQGIDDIYKVLSSIRDGLQSSRGTSTSAANGSSQ